MSATTERRTGRRGLRAAAAVAALALAAGLSACSPSEPGAAAIVGDRQVSTQDVTAAVKGIRTGNPQLAQGGDLDRTVIFFLIISPFVLEQAQAAGAGVSADEARAQLPETNDPDPGAVEVLRTFLALQKLQQVGDTTALTTVQNRLKTAKVRVNPRFGRLEPNELQIVDRTPNWLVPVAAPAPTDQPVPTP